MEWISRSKEILGDVRSLSVETPVAKDSSRRLTLFGPWSERNAYVDRQTCDWINHRFAPEPKVFDVDLPCGPVCKAERAERAVDDVDEIPGQYSPIPQLVGRSGPKNVNEETTDKDKAPASPAERLGVHSLCGRGVHGGSVVQKL